MIKFTKIRIFPQFRLSKWPTTKSRAARNNLHPTPNRHPTSLVPPGCPLSSTGGYRVFFGKAQFNPFSLLMVTIAAMGYARWHFVVKLTRSDKDCKKSIFLLKGGADLRFGLKMSTNSILNQAF